MRIDFSQFDSDETSTKPHQLKINNNLLPFWGQQQEEENMFRKSRQDQPEVNFSVEYPYQVSRSVSPQAMKKQFSYLEAKQVLPKSTVNFIKASIVKERTKKIEEDMQNQLSEQSLHSLYLESKSKSKQKSLSKGSTQNRYPPQGRTQNRYPLESSIQASPLRKKKQCIAPTQGIGVRSQQRAKEKADRIKKVAQEVLARRKDKQVADLTLRPVLNYTMNSKTAKRVEEKRKAHFNSTHTTVFESLYSDAARNTAKRQIQKMKVNQKNQKDSNKISRIQVGSTFEDRLRRSLESSAERKRMAQNKQEVDPSTGKKMFVPDTYLSKITYYSHFKSSCSICPFSIEQTPARPERYSRQSQKLDKSHRDITTTLNHSLDELSHLHRKCQGKPEIVPTLSGRREEKLADLFADLLWKNGSLDRSQLTAEEEKVMIRFLEELTQFQYSASVSKQIFATLFKDFLGRLNLFDKGVLLKRLKKPPEKPCQQSSRSDANSSFSILKSKISHVAAPDHKNKYFYV